MMPTRPRLRSHQPLPATAHRAMYTRTSGDLLKGGLDPTAGVNPSGIPPVIWWHGLDSGAGAHPIGPHGPWASGYGEALPVVMRATGLLVDPIAQSPLVVHDMANAGRPLGTPRWLLDPCLTRRDERVGPQVQSAVSRLTRSKWVGDLLRSALWFGLGGFVFVEDETGQPTAGTLRLIHPGFLTTERDVNGALCWVLGAEQSYQDRLVADRDGYLTVAGVRHRIMVLRHPGAPVDTEGMSAGVFAMNPGAFSLGSSIESYAAGVFRSGVPSGYLKLNVPGATQAQVDELRSAWNLAHGSTSYRSTAVLSASTEYVPISMSPVDTALAEVQQLSVASVAYSFNISPEMLGVSMGASLTYSNTRDHFRQHKNLSLGIWLAALQDMLSSLLPGAQTVVVDTDAFTRPEPAERYEAYAVALDNGILTLDEVRANEGLPPLGASATPEQARSLSAAETSQKVYLAVQAGVLSVEEARVMIQDAGGKLDPTEIPGGVAPVAPAAAPGSEPAAVRALRSQSWRH